MEWLKLFVGKGRITLWLLILACTSLGLTGMVDGDKVLAAIVTLGSFALGGESGSRVPKEE